MHRGTERTSYIPFLLLKLTNFFFFFATNLARVHFFIKLLELVNVVPCCGFLPVPDFNFPVDQDGLSIDLNEEPGSSILDLNEEPCPSILLKDIESLL